MKIQKKKIGELLIDSGMLTQSDVERGLKAHRETGVSFGKAIINLGLIEEHDLLAALSDQLEIPYLHLDSYKTEKQLTSLVTEKFARHNLIVPLFRIGDSLSIGVADSSNLETLDELNKITKLNTEPVLCLENEIKAFLDELYGTSKPMIDVLEKIKGLDKSVHDDDTSEPIIQMVQLIIEEAIKLDASDIHINPDENVLRVRFRIDGVLETVYEQPIEIKDEILSRFKVMSNLNITEKRLPQDGRFQLQLNKNSYDFRVSTFPTYFGENIVIRILDHSSVIVNLDGLGMTSETLKQFLEILKLSNGIILVTGPTGSGKTTTLYSALNVLNTIDKNIITIEDPIEYRLPFIRQSNMNAKIGMTFASGLRSILRQDPDIIMVGEIRDRETAAVAVQAALTGHLVLSTLHTNDTVSTITRLMEMGLEPFLVSATAKAILAQRLVRKICTQCRESYKPDSAMLDRLGIGAIKTKDITFSRGKGCKLCRQSGYKGRIGIYELLAVSDKLKNLIVRGSTYDELMQQALKEGFIKLKYDGIRKVIAGMTTIDEVLRVSD